MSDNTGGGDSFQVFSSQSWFGRLKGALIGVLIGILLVPGSIWLIAWNEGHAVNIARDLAEGSGAVVDVPVDRVDPGNQGRLVHIGGRLDVPGTLADPDYNVRAPGAAKLVRRVEMFQWEQKESSETRKTLGGGTETVTTYHYNKVWSDQVIDSARFKQANGHGNPAFRIRSRTQVAPQARIGAFRLDSAILDQLGPQDPLTIEAPPPSGQLSDGGVYLGTDPANPAVGDLRIHYFTVHPQAASVIAQQEGDSLRPFPTKGGRTLLLVASDSVPASVMFKGAAHENAVMAWILRAVGVLAMLIGFYLLLRPLAVFADLLPFLGSLVAGGVGITALLLTVIVAPLVIAIAWLAVRPLVGGLVLAGAAVAAVLTTRWMRARRVPRSAGPGGFAPSRIS